MYEIFFEITARAWLGFIIALIILPLDNGEIEDFISRKYLPATILITLATLVLFILARYEK